MNGSDGPSLEIYYKDEKVTGTTKDVWVGQLITLVAKSDPAGQNIKDPAWTVPDKIVGGYKAEVSKGEVTKFDPGSLKNSSVKFYWVTSGSKQVTFKGTINGVVNDVTTTFNVQRPEVTVVINPDKNTKPELADDPAEPNRIILRKEVEWDRHGQSQEGDITWVQRAKVDVTILFDVDHYAQGPGMEFYGDGLDGNEFSYHGGDPVLSDTPQVRTDRRIALSMWRNDSFKDWIMFKHKQAGSIWVPLKKVEWYWWGNASRSGNAGTWTLDSFDYEKNPQAKDADDFPEWDSNIPEPIVLTPIS